MQLHVCRRRFALSFLLLPETALETMQLSCRMEQGIAAGSQVSFLACAGHVCYMSASVAR